MNDQEAVSELTELERQYWEALLNGHSSCLLMLHERFRAWPQSATEPQDRDEVAKRLQRYKRKPSHANIELREVVVVRDVGIVYLARIHNNSADRLTHTWIKENDGWKLIGGMSCGG